MSDFDIILAQFAQINEKLNALSADRQPDTLKPAEIRYLTRADVAGIFGITVNTVDEWIRRGKLTAYRSGRKIRLKSNDVDRVFKLIETGSPNQRENQSPSNGRVSHGGKFREKKAVMGARASLNHTGENHDDSKNNGNPLDWL